MPKDRQHFIPQTYQRGFLDPTLKDERAWELRRTGPPRPTLILKIGRAHAFYSPPNSGGLDDDIKAIEDLIGPKLAALRDGPTGPTDPTEAAFLVDHLSLRTAHLRGMFAEGAQAIAATADHLFGDEARARRVMGLIGTTPSEHFAAQVSEHLLSDPRFIATGFPKSFLTRMAFAFGREMFHDTYADMAPGIASLISGFSDGAKSLANDSHKKAVAGALAGSERAVAMAQFAWEVVEVPDHVVAPDCVSLGLTPEGGLEPLAMLGRDDTVAVLMPISGVRLLVGRRSRDVQIDLTRFNYAAAAASQDFLIADRNWPGLHDLQPLMGSEVRRGMEAALSEAVRERLPSDPDLEPPTAQDGPSTRAPASYVVHFPDCHDEAEARRLSDLMGVVVQSANSHLSLARLDGFTIAHDYGTALFNLDRGALELPPVTATSSPANGPTGIAVNVRRDGALKVHLVASYSAVSGLLSEAEEHRAISVRALMFLLAHVDVCETLDRCAPERVFQPFDNGLDATFGPMGEAAWLTYCAGRASGGYHPAMSGWLAEMFISALDEMAQAIPAARLDYRFHGETSRFLGEALPRVRAVLRHGAELLGDADFVRPRDAPLDRDALSQLPAEVAAALKRQGLERWFRLFAADLREIWRRGGTWESVHSLGLHGERLLWQHGVFPWLTDVGGIWVAVPLGTDEGRLFRETLARPVRHIAKGGRQLLAGLGRAAGRLTGRAARP